MYEDGLSIPMFEISACHNWLIILPRYCRKHLIRELRIMLARFSTLLYKKWVRRFVYVNPVAFSKRARPGRRSSKIFSDSARLRLSYFHEKCLQPLQCAVATVQMRKIRYPRWRLWKMMLVWYWEDSCAICIDLIDENSSMIAREKYRFYPLSFSSE